MVRAVILLDRKIKSHEAVVFTDLDDGSAVLLHLDNKFYYSLNETGSFMWQQIEKNHGSMGVSQLVQSLCEQFEVGPEQAVQDVNDFLDDLSREGLVEVK